MKTIHETLIATTTILMLALLVIADSPLAMSVQRTYSLDTLDLDSAHVMKTAMDISGHPIVWRKGDTVTATAKDGTASTLVAEAENDGSLSWIPPQGGVWVLENDMQGAAVFVIRHSLCGTSGDGTENSPARISDSDELAELCDAGTAGDGFVFTLDGLDSLFAELVIPTGFSLEQRSNGTCRIMTTVGGLIFSGAVSTQYAVDGRTAGPDRRLGVKDCMPLAYTGDGWMRDPSAASMLTIVSPSGAQTDYSLSGTSTLPFTPSENGKWIISLISGEDSLTAQINVIGGLIMSFR